MKLANQLLLLLPFIILLSCNHFKKHVDQLDQTKEAVPSKMQLYELEKKWLEYEFAADTASIAAFMDTGFIAVAAEEVVDKKAELEGVYRSVMKMKADSISIDSFKIEQPFVVKQFDNTAIVTFICHTYEINKGAHSQRRTRFYDVWRNVNGNWKAVSSQATTVEEIN